MVALSVPIGECAGVVTRLEMTARPRPAPLPSAPFRLVRWASPDPDRYRTLFRRVGEPWLWYSRLVIDEAALSAIITDPAVEVFAVVDRAGIEVGMVELDFRTERACEIAYFALVPELTGQKLGRWLMAQTLVRAWQLGIDQVWLHTCTLDHPSALNFYRACGFVAVARRIETFPDPRLLGLIDRSAAPHVPLLDAS
ncbi:MULTISPECIES: GNAT family N-acetyltransferase [unclassified Sphingomonas]|uniref:GNAT family N-acetyltransferase n=1 Tax=unclassified Sphingomonas TaxID=196159 RepID=UPI000BD5219C|nr:MAG: GNAT family N-acetyltransferase [Sphingomonas sp. 32-62-10]OYY66366.1 MAG: GNAT family N-acetyltransferase [Sphingomonas sp. 28-62-11]